MKKVGFLQFLFKIGDDYLMFLRNLTPAVLFLSLALFMYSELNWAHWAWSNVLVLFLSLASGFIAQNTDKKAVHKKAETAYLFEICNLTAKRGYTACICSK